MQTPHAGPARAITEKDVPTIWRVDDPLREMLEPILERPHEALAGRTPAARDQPSPRPFPAVLPAGVYDPGDAVRTVTAHRSIPWPRRRVFVSRGLVGQPVAVRPTQEDGRWTVSFCQQQVATIDLRDPHEV